MKEEKEKNGGVWLVGAGPGDAGLLTIKGKQILAEADTVIYDALVGAGILGWIPEQARQIYVGKRGGSHTMPQEKIGQLLVEEAKKGRRVVRLKGGDSFVFGRGSEEAALLKKHEIPFEIVPGVTSAVAVPAYCGIPVTHRGTAASFHVITGHLKNGEPVELDYEALTRVGGTLIFLMGMANAEMICNGLMEHGMNRKTPAAFLQEGTTSGQKKVLSTLENLVEDGKKQAIKPPAILIIGDVCGLEADCCWAEKLPLFGKRILVTRPERRAGHMVEKLRKAGAEAVELPAVQTRLLEDSTTLCDAVMHMEQYDWLAFTSPSGVELFFKYLKSRRVDARILSGVKLAVIGRGTAEMLEQYGMFAEYMPERYYAADLGTGLAERMAAHEKLLILRAKKGSLLLTFPLVEKSLHFDDVALYETLYREESPQAERIKELLEKRAFDFVTFTSASTVEGFMALLHPSPEMTEGFTAVCIGEETGKRAVQAGMNCIIAEVPSMDSMIEVMERMRD